MWKKKSAGSKYLRNIVAKLNAVDASLDADYWGPVYEGTGCSPLTAVEEKARARVFDQSMPLSTAQRIRNSLDKTKPFYTRLEIIEAIASLSRLFSDEMGRKVAGPNKPLHDILWSGILQTHITM